MYFSRAVECTLVVLRFKMLSKLMLLFSCVSSVIDREFCHYVVKVAVNRRVDLQTSIADNENYDEINFH